MAQELEQIVEMLREMNKANNNNSENFDKLLASINDKLEMVDKNVATADLVKAYLSELAKATDDKYTTTMDRFSEIEKALRTIFNEQDSHVKNKDIRELFDIFSTNLNNFYSEVRQQKASISGIEGRLAEIANNKSDKNDIMQTISLLKNDIGNINHSYKSTIDSINTDLKTILTNLIKSDQTNTNIQIKEQVEIMYKAVSDIVNYLTSIDKRDANLEQLLSNVATTENLKITQSVVASIIEKSEEISERISLLADKTDIEELKAATNYMNKKIEETATKELLSEISEKADSLTSLTDNIKQTLAKVSQDIDILPDTSNIEESLQNLFQKLDNLSLDIDKLDSIENISNIDSKITNLTEDLFTIKNILDDLNEVVTLKVLTAINDLSFEKECSEIKDLVSKILASLPQKEDIDRLLENNELSKQAVNDLIKRTDIISDKLDTSSTHADIEKLTNKTDEIEKMIDNLNFNKEFESLYDKSASIENWLITSNIKENTEALASKMDSKAEQKDMLTVLNTVENIVDRIDKLSKKFNSKETSKSDTMDIKNAIFEVKEILENKKSNLKDTELEDIETFKAIGNYLEEIKEILSNSDNEITEEVKSKIINIETCINKHQHSSGTAITAIINKLEDYQNKINLDEPQALDLTPAFAEISEIKAQIFDLAKSFESLELSTPEQMNSSVFVSEILNELGSNLESLSSNIDDKLQHGFVYNAELIEEKTAIIIDFIRGLKESNNQDSTLYSKLDNADDKLNDYKQELEFINTDVKNILNSQTEQLVQELEPIKEMLSELANTPAAKAEVKESLSNLHESVFEELYECAKYSKETFDKLEDSYERISRNLTDTENNLKDFILGDIDSVIIKIDSLRSDLEDSLNRISPPDAEQMAEFKKFVEQIAQFNGNPAELVAEATQEISQNLNETLAQQHEELKSILAVSINNEEIITAIEELKNCFYSKIELLNEFNNTASQHDELLDDFDSNQFEQAFEVNKNEEVLAELREDFDKFTNMVKELTDENSEICEILNVIKNKMESISVVKTENTITETDTNTENNEIIVGTGDFDFVKALDLLKQDIQKLHEDVAKVIPKEEQKKASSALSALPSISIGGADNKLLTALSEKIDLLCQSIKPNEWLEDIQAYIGGDIIQALLDEINGKVDILTLADHSEVLEEIKVAISQISVGGTTVTSDPEIQKMLTIINEKIDVLASNNDYELFEEVRDAIDRLDFATTDNSETERLLSSIDSKIDVIASTDNFSEFEEIKDTLSEADARITSILKDLENKVEALSDKDNESAKFELEEIKSLILNQTEHLEKFEQNDNTEALRECLDNLVEEVNKINSTDNSELTQSLRDVKESIMAAIVTVFEQISFIEESEDIKDFVEEKTDEINQNLATVTNQLKQITNAEEDTDYIYSMQDIESDLAKLRLALSNLQESGEETQAQRLSSILENINTIGLSVEELQNSITKDDELRDKFERVTTDINSLSVLTNQLLVSSGESYNALSSSFEGFGKLITDKLATKVDKVTKLLETSHASDNVMRQALIYMGEWIDSASESMNKISTNSEEIIDIKSSIESLKKSVPEQTDILNSIEEKFDEQQERLAYFEKQISKLGGLEDKFEAQQARIDRLEMSIERILTAVEDIDDSKVNRKIDKIDKQLAKLSTNIEKLASYVD